MPEMPGISEGILFALALLAVMRFASTDRKSPIHWGALMFLICGGALFIPVPYLRAFIAFVVCFVVMFVYNIVTARNESGGARREDKGSGTGAAPDK